MALAGAGGGGFLFALTKEANFQKELANLIDSNNLNMKIYDAKISNDGIRYSFI